MRYGMIMLVVLLAGCSNKPSAVEVCGKLEAAGVATKCRVSQPGGIGAAATERVEFVVVVRLSRAERAQLKALAKKTGEYEAELMRRLVREEATRVSAG